MNIVLETTSEERALWLANAIHDTSFVARVCRDFAKVHERAEGLAKEVERLKDAAATAARTFHDNQWQQLKEAEAKLAVYEAPRIGTDGPTLYEQSVEIDRLTAEVSALSAAHAECKGENTKLREALKGVRADIAKAPDDTWGCDTMGDADVPGGLMSWPVKDEILHYIDAALAPASEEATNG